MNRALSILVSLAWGVWIGGLVGVFVAVTSLSRTFAEDRTTFGTAASGVFAAFERVQLVVAAAALVLTFAWRLRGGAAGLKTALFALLALGAVAAVVETTYVAPRIEQMRAAGTTQTTEFKKLHGMSMMLYTGTTGLLAVGGIFLTLAVARDEKRARPAGSGYDVVVKP